MHIYLYMIGGLYYCELDGKEKGKWKLYMKNDFKNQWKKQNFYLKKKLWDETE